MAGDLDTAHPGEARLRAALAAAASGPVPPAWETIRARVLDGEEIVPLPQARSARRSSGPAALAAAVLLVVLAVAGALVVSQQGDDEQLTQVGGTVADQPAGWFVPADLPAGWSVTSVTARRPDEPRCPGPEGEPARGIRWTRPSSPNAAVVVTAGRCDTVEAVRGPGPEVLSLVERAAPVDVDLGPVTGVLAESLVGSDHRITWELDGEIWIYEAMGLSLDEAVAVARGIATAGSFDAAPEGFTEDDRWTEPPRPRTVVEVAVTSDEGVELAYVLSPTGAGEFRSRADNLPAGPPGPEPEVRAITYATTPWTLRHGIVAPGVDVDVWARVGPGDPLAVRQAGAGQVAGPARTLAEALVPASSRTWGDLLAGVDHSAVLEEAETFDAVEALDVPPG